MKISDRKGLDMKRILLLSLFTVLLASCGAEELVEKENHEPDQEIEAATENKEEDSTPLINKPITTSFKPKVREVPPPLTDEEQALHNELNERIASEIQPQTTDREFMESIAGDYDDYSPEELAEFWYRGYDVIWYGAFGEQAIDHQDLMGLVNQVIETNIAAETYDESLGVDWNEDLTMTKSEGTFMVDGQVQKVSIHLEYSDDYERAELVRFVVNGESFIK